MLEDKEFEPFVDTRPTEPYWRANEKCYDTSDFRYHPKVPLGIRNEQPVPPPEKGSIRSDHSFCVEEITLPDHENVAPFLSTTRVLTHLCVGNFNEKSLNKRPIDIMIISVPGFGESSAHFDTGDLPKIILSELLRQGYRKPHVVFLNPLGGGTKEFMQNK